MLELPLMAEAISQGKFNAEDFVSGNLDEDGLGNAIEVVLTAEDSIQTPEDIEEFLKTL
jgi:hypothetical protein